MARPRSVMARFWEKVPNTPDEGCWLWEAHADQNGYGTFWSGRRLMMAHCFAYEQNGDPIPAGYKLDHLCHNADPACERGICVHRRCVRPDHLEAVTTAENNRRAAAKLTHCPQGHPYTPENTMTSRGRRYCRICRRANYRRWEAAQSAQANRKRHYRYLDHEPRNRDTTCPNGHAYEGDNLLIRSNGQRACRACQAAKNRRAKAARAARS